MMMSARQGEKRILLKLGAAFEHWKQLRMSYLIQKWMLLADKMSAVAYTRLRIAVAVPEVVGDVSEIERIVKTSTPDSRY